MSAALLLILLAGADDGAAVVERLGEGSFAARERATAELAALGAKALEAMVRAADHPDAEVRRRVSPILAEALIDELGHDELSRRERAFGLLVRLGWRAEPALFKGSGHADLEIRRLSANALKKVRETKGGKP